MTIDGFIMDYPDHPLTSVLRNMHIPGRDDFELLKGMAVGMILLFSYEKLFPDPESLELLNEIKGWEYTRRIVPEPNEIN